MADVADYQRLRADTGHSVQSLPDAAAADLFAQAELLYGVGTQAVLPATRELALLQLLGSAAKLHDYVQNQSRENASQVYKNLRDQLDLWTGRRQAAAAADTRLALGSCVSSGRAQRKPARGHEYPLPTGSPLGGDLWGEW